MLGATRASANWGRVDDACRVARDRSVLRESYSHAHLGEQYGVLPVDAFVMFSVVDVIKYPPLDEVERQKVWFSLMRRCEMERMAYSLVDEAGALDVKSQARVAQVQETAGEGLRCFRQLRN